MRKPSNKLTTDQLGRLIYEIRGERVMLDSDLASIYGVETKALNRAVKRNRDRFPKDFVFQISGDDWKNLRYQIGTSSSGHGGRRRRPYVFTEHGAIMAANVLNSRRAVQMSVFWRGVLDASWLASNMRLGRENWKFDVKNRCASDGTDIADHLTRGRKQSNARCRETKWKGPSRDGFQCCAVNRSSPESSCGDYFDTILEE